MSEDAFQSGEAAWNAARLRRRPAGTTASTRRLTANRELSLPEVARDPPLAFEACKECIATMRLPKNFLGATVQKKPRTAASAVKKAESLRERPQEGRVEPTADRHRAAAPREVEEISHH